MRRATLQIESGLLDQACTAIAIGLLAARADILYSVL